MKALWDAQALK